MNDFLEIEGLCKSFPSGQEELHILVNLDLRLAAGRMLAVTGASGSGKSTLLHLVGGMESPDAGSIRVGGRDITRLEPDELACFRNEQIGFVFQFHHLLPEFTALENVMFPLLLRRIPRPRAVEKARLLLSEVGLAGRVEHRPGELSGGEQQRVAIARALAGDPRLLLADEPTGNVDAHTSERIYALLTDVHRSHGLTSIVVTHNPRLAAICDEEKRMINGQLVAVGSTSGCAGPNAFR